MGQLFRSITFLYIGKAQLCMHHKLGLASLHAHSPVSIQRNIRVAPQWQHQAYGTGRAFFPFEVATNDDALLCVLSSCRTDDHQVPPVFLFPTFKTHSL